jgi:hypothetical protein
MRMCLAALSVACICLHVTPGAYAEPQASEKPGFLVAIQAAAEGGPRFTVTNLSGKAVTACVMQMSLSSEGRPQSEIEWDALLQGVQPLEPGANISQYLSHTVGGPIPDKVDVIAGVWADGKSFGQPNWVKNIIENRDLRASEYEQATHLLQQGLDQHWTREQFLTALDGKGKSGPVYGLRSTLEANKQLDERPELLKRVVQLLLEQDTQKAKLLRQALVLTSQSSEP